MNATNLIAVPQAKIAEASGVITYWRLSGTIVYAELRAAWERAALNVAWLPEEPSVNTALKRALDFLAPKGSMIKALKNKDGYTAIVPAGEEGAVQEWRSTMSAWFDNGRVRTEGVPSDDELINLLESELGMLHPQDVSTWLVKMADRHQAISLRESGGFYFIPRVFGEQWSRFTDVLESVSSAGIYAIPAMQSDAANVAVLDALNDEVAVTVQHMTSALAEKSYGVRAVGSKIGRCNELIAKIETYETLLGQRLVNLREHTEELKAKYVQAEVTLMNEAAKR